MSTTKHELRGMKIHFVAIGGIGMSALARLAAAQGAIVSGCDTVDSHILTELRAYGCATTVGHSPEHVIDADLVVRSTAVPLDSPEIRAADARKIPVITRGRLLALIQNNFETIAISGAHGKTTTTWIIGNMLMRVGADPTIAIGGTVQELNGNARTGNGKFFVTESDESDGSFLLFKPTYPVVTNIDADHLDHWGSLENIKKAFVEFCEPANGGAVIACTDCPNVREAIASVRGRKITCGIDHGEIRAKNVWMEPFRTVFDADVRGRIEKDVTISLPGMHNVKNALAALALAEELSFPIHLVRAAFENTSRVGRRFELRGTVNGISVYDDYAHHPAEIEATLAAARRIAQRKLIVVFQPHRYTRTQELHRDFGAVFHDIDLLLLAPVYPASEPPIPGVDSGLIAQSVRGVPCEVLQDLDAAPERVAQVVEPGDIVMTIGAGNVYQVGDELLALVEKQTADAA